MNLFARLFRRRPAPPDVRPPDYMTVIRREQTVPARPLTLTRTFKQAPTRHRIWELVEVRGENECWPWTGGPLGFKSLNNTYKVRGQRTLTRAVYVASRGLMPKGKVMHTCKNEACGNPAHVYDSHRQDRFMPAAASNHSSTS